MLAAGDRRGKQSVALLVAPENCGYAGLNYRYIDLRVDGHPEPSGELRRLYERRQELFGLPANGSTSTPAAPRS